MGALATPPPPAPGPAHAPASSNGSNPGISNLVASEAIRDVR
jgi:hypothetical protein